MKPSCGPCVADETAGPRPTPSTPWIAALIDIETDGLEATKEALCDRHRQAYERYLRMRTELLREMLS